jgi:hypothetical protein
MALPDLASLPEWHDLCLRYQSSPTLFAMECLGMDVTWQQDMLFRSVAFPGSRTTVASGHGCFGLDTMVMLSDGLDVAVQDVRVGDRLMGDDGCSIRNVLELKRGRENMYRFTYMDGTSHVFNESHILCLVATNSKGNRKSGERTTVTVRDWLTWGADKKRCHAIYRSGVESFAVDRSELPVDPYILGTWLGDGSSRWTDIVTEDHEIMQAWKDYALVVNCRFVHRLSGDKGNAKTYALSKTSNSNNVRNEFYHALKDLGVIQNKHVPQMYLSASLEDRKQLLAGLIDTDGSLDGCGYDFVQKKEVIARQVWWLARSIGCHATIKPVTKKCVNNGVVGNYFRVTIGRNCDLIPVRIARKKRPDLNHQRRNLHFGIKHVEPLGEGDYYGFVLDGNNQFLGADFTVLHNTGKSRSAGVVALWHLLFFENSVMMFTAPSITQLRNIVWKEVSMCLAALKKGVFAWLADYVALFAEKIYIKGHDKDWHVIAKTASKSNPTTIAGQHGDNYMLWGDEGSGIDDKVMEVALGALTHKDNRCVLTSQPTRPTGFFFDTHHRLSHKAGGVWTALTFNGEQSPLVSEAVLREMLQKYTSRDDPGYMIRVRGLFPDLSNEFLITRTQADDMYTGACLFEGAHDDYGYLITVDVGGGMGRDDSVIAVSKVWGSRQHGEGARRAEVIDIPLCKNTDNLHELAGIINECLVRYSNASLVVDDNGAGIGLGQHLKAKGIYYKSAKWGGPCFNRANQRDYFNKRSMAYVCLSRAVAQGRFKMLTNKHSVKVKEQITRTKYAFDDNSRYKILSKEELQKQGIRSPDIVDTFAYIFLEGVVFTQANEVLADAAGGDVSDDMWAQLEAAAKDL